MSYQVLARKWRPKQFREMVGQEHVLKALIHALDHDRLHHAYLFTGTRGVGKTSIARILAKCLNCESSVSSEACGQCSSCQEINEGRFIDLIEVDAASKTKVEDTRDLLENVQYRPTRGRYKVYLIDEVHMLSNSSFNALLKTLEEPPPHVKFLLATTDPKKVPVTVLSRCLQFNLRHLSSEKIAAQLEHILTEEQIDFDIEGIRQLSRSAEGSLRDALSLTDQAIAHGSGKISDEAVRGMLGSIDFSHVDDILKALVAGDASELLKATAKLSEWVSDYAGVLAALIERLHQIALAQVLPQKTNDAHGVEDRERVHVQAFAQDLTAEDVQLYFQIALLGRQDLSLSPDPRIGFEMLLLRMLAFTLDDAPHNAAPTPKGSSHSSTHSNPQAPSSPTTEVSAVSSLVSTVEETQQTDHTLSSIAITPTLEKRPDESAFNSASIRQINPSKISSSQTNSYETISSKPHISELTAQTWPQLYKKLSPQGMLQSIVSHLGLVSVASAGQQVRIEFLLDEDCATLYDTAHQQRVAELLSDYFSMSVDVSIKIGKSSLETPAQKIQQERERQQQQAKSIILSSPVVQALQARFDAEIVPGSIKSLH